MIGWTKKTHEMAWKGLALVTFKFYLWWNSEVSHEDKVNDHGIIYVFIVKIDILYVLYPSYTSI